MSNSEFELDKIMVQQFTEDFETTQMWLRKGTAHQIATVNSDDLESEGVRIDRKSGAEVLCSYSWRKDPIPTIYVPGSPPKWTPRKLPVILRPDADAPVINTDDYGSSRYSFEPMFKAISIMSPNQTFNDVDFVANRNSMRKLLNFMNGYLVETFRMDLKMVQNTLFINRVEQDSSIMATGARRFRGYGHSFEEMFTTRASGLEDSTSYHRALKYKIGDLRCVIRYEVDAWIPESKDQPDAVNGSKDREDNNEDASKLFKKLSLSTELQSNTEVPPGETRVIFRGNPVPSDSLAEIKTSHKMPFNKFLAAQLWFGRVPRLVFGRNKHGLMSNLTISDTDSYIKAFENNEQSDLCKLMNLIKRLRSLTEAELSRACVVVCDARMKLLKLEVYAVDEGGDVLPERLIEVHWPKLS